MLTEKEKEIQTMAGCAAWFVRGGERINAAMNTEELRRAIWSEAYDMAELLCEQKRNVSELRNMLHELGCDEESMEKLIAIYNQTEHYDLGDSFFRVKEKDSTARGQ